MDPHLILIPCAFMDEGGSVNSVLSFFRGQRYWSEYLRSAPKSGIHDRFGRLIDYLVIERLYLYAYLSAFKLLLSSAFFFLSSGM
jgi:hypothetical protein